MTASTKWVITAYGANDQPIGKSTLTAPLLPLANAMISVAKIGSGYPSGSQTASYIGYPSGTTAGRIANITCRPAVVPSG